MSTSNAVDPEQTTSLAPARRRKYLATDLDGTLIPLDGDAAAITALEKIRQWHDDGRSQRPNSDEPKSATGDQFHLPLLYVTGRHFESVIEGIEHYGLPVPDWILCDVGTSFYLRTQITTKEGAAERSQGKIRDLYCRNHDYEGELTEIFCRGEGSRADIEEHRRAFAELPGFRLQERFKQGRHKLSYYVPADRLDDCCELAESLIVTRGFNGGVVSSVDPFNGDGLLDVLPRGVSKAYALDWWRRGLGLEPADVVFCGDSGNDFAALVAGYLAVVVGNASRSLAEHVDRVHREKGWSDRLLLAAQTSTAGVLEGMHWFGILNAEPPHSTLESDNDGAGSWGATLVGHRRTQFRCYAPRHDRLTLELTEPRRQYAMTRQDDGFFVATIDDVPASSRYGYLLDANGVSSSRTRLLDAPESNDDGIGQLLPDPASRFQPLGVHGPSQVVRHHFPWRYDSVPRVSRREQLVLYELHVGTFTDQGTFTSAIERLDELCDLGITALELMPVAACPGRWNWGYDATFWYAPMASLGTPDDFRRLVDEAHRRGLAVILDVVYNHFGPEGNYVGQFGGYLSPRHQTAWGPSPHLDDPAIRRFVIDNAMMWLREYHLDGLRVDAIHCMEDDSDPHITEELGHALRRWASKQERPIWLIAETNVHDEVMTVPLGQGGVGFDAQWCDDFLHGVFANLRPGEQLTGRTYQSHDDLAMVLIRGFVFSGDVRGFRGRIDSTSDAVGAVDRGSQVICIQNHDFIGNHPLGQRLHQLTSLETQAAAATLALMMPGIPMIFMGEEFACERPFQFFVDFGEPSLQQAVVAGRRRDYPQHDWSTGVLPIDPAAMLESKIGPRQAGSQTMLQWYRQLLLMRRQWIGAELLRAENFSVGVDLPRSLYRLNYEHDHQRLSVVVRLCEFDSATKDQLEDLSDAKIFDGLPKRLIGDSRHAITGQKEATKWAPQHARVYLQSLTSERG